MAVATRSASRPGVAHGAGSRTPVLSVPTRTDLPVHASAPPSLRDDQCLRLRPLARLVRRGPGRWEVAIGGATRELCGGTTDRVLPEIEAALAGDVDVSTAVSRLEARGVAADEARGSLELLYRWEILDDAAGYRGGSAANASAAQEHFFSLVSSRPVASQRAVGAYRVAVDGGDRAAEELRRVVRCVGFGLVADPGEADLVIHWSARLDDAAVRAVNRVCVERAQSLLAVGAAGTVGWVGPTVLPRDGACVECVLDAGGGELSLDADAPGGRGTPGASVVAHLAALEALRLAAPCLRPGLVGIWQRYDPGRHRLVAVEATRRPRCRVCGALSTRSPAAAFQVRGEPRDGS